jgi:hypothetical protein
VVLVGTARSSEPTLVGSVAAEAAEPSDATPAKASAAASDKIRDMTAPSKSER